MSQQRITGFFTGNQPRKKLASPILSKNSEETSSILNSSAENLFESSDISSKKGKKRKLTENSNSEGYFSGDDTSFSSTKSGFSAITNTSISLMTSSTKSSSKTSGRKKSKMSRLIDNDDTQMILDAGQKKFGPEQCELCKMFYHPQSKQDAMLHEKYHQETVGNRQLLIGRDASANGAHSSANFGILELKGNGLKPWRSTFRPIQEYLTGNIFSVTAKSPTAIRNKVENVVEMISGDLGFACNNLPLWSNDRRVLVFLSNGSLKATIQGVAVIEQIKKAYPILPAKSDLNPQEYDCISGTPKKAALGINRIWVCPQARRMKIAKKLVDCARCNIFMGVVVPISMVAFTDPTSDGKAFAANYCGGLDKVMVYQGVN